MSAPGPGPCPAVTVDGAARPLRLTLGALAEIEEALGGDLEALKARLAAPRVCDLLVILAALLRGGGTALSLEALKGAEVDLAEAAGAIAAAFAALEAPGKSPSAAGAPPGPPPSSPP